jgi:hypothetical protein
MTSFQDFLGLASTLVVLAVIIAGVMKLFQVASDMQELKEILKDIRRSMPGVAQLAPVPASPASLGIALREGGQPHPDAAPRPNAPTAEELVRAIHQQDFRGENFPFKD